MTPPVRIQADCRVRSKLRLQSWWKENGDSARQSARWGNILPRKVGETRGGDVRTLCVGPSDWLLVSEVLGTDAISSWLVESSAVTDEFVAVDVSEGLRVVTLSGGSSRDLVSKGCGLDLDPQVFPVGRCARTRLAGLPVIIDCDVRLDCLNLYVSRSFHSWFEAWLSDAAAEFELPY